MKIIFFGTPAFVIPVLQTLVDNFEVIAVVTAPDKKVGRKQLLTPSPVKQYAQSHNIPVLELPQLKIENEKPDLFVVAAYGKIIPQSILDIPKFGALNIHPSALPQYRGASPLQYALLNGDQQTAVSIMKMDDQMDHGPLLLQKPLPILPTDTFETLAQKAFQQAAELLPPIIKQYTNGKLLPQEQDHSKATYTKIIKKDDAYIDKAQFDNLSEMESGKWKLEIARKIHAYYPWPTAWTKVKRNNRELILKLLPQGKLQLEGKQPLSKKDFLNGYPDLREFIEKIS
jgi:methionyl-tRNA formyltransferase